MEGQPQQQLPPLLLLTPGPAASRLQQCDRVSVQASVLCVSLPTKPGASTQAHTESSLQLRPC